MSGEPIAGGLRFDSAREAGRWQVLLAEARAGRIGGLRRQVAYPLTVTRPDGVAVAWAEYRADFVYARPAGGALVVEDAKGHKTEVYRLKRRAFEAQYGIRILET